MKKILTLIIGIIIGLLLIFMNVQQLMAQPNVNNNHNVHQIDNHSRFNRGNVMTNNNHNKKPDGWGKYCNPRNPHYNPKKCEQLYNGNNVPIDSNILILMISGIILAMVQLIKRKLL